MSVSENSAMKCKGFSFKVNSQGALETLTDPWGRVSHFLIHHNLFITLLLGSKMNSMFAKQPLCIQTNIQYNLNGSNPCDSFTVDDSNSFFLSL